MKKLKLLFIVIFGLIAFQIHAQVKISGRVVDDTGEPMIGATIQIKGTTEGTVTDLDGNYTIDVDNADATLIFSSVGYKKIEEVISRRTRIDVTFQEDIEELEEVVVIGYGTTKKSDLTASISSVTAEELTSKPVTTVEQALQGRASGVFVNQGTGEPGKGPSITIRGIGSIQSGTRPLWIIDGVMVSSNEQFDESTGQAAFNDDPMSSISPDDIERIEILKDAASTAIYGSRGSNGVILVTTKSGNKGKNTIDAGYSYQWRHRINKYDLLNASELMQVLNEVRINDGKEPLYSEAQINGTEPVDGFIANTDWQDVVDQVGGQHNFRLSSSGGNDKTTYYISGNYIKEEGTIIGSGLEKANGRINLQHKINKKLDLGANVSIYQTNIDAFRTEGQSFNPGPAGAVLQMPPFYPIYDSIGEYYRGYRLDNPLEAALSHLIETKKTGSVGKIYANYKVIPSLSVELSADGDYLHTLYREFVPDDLKSTSNPYGGRTHAEVRNDDYFKWTARSLIRFNKAFGIHNIQVLGGYEVEYRENVQHKIEVEGLEQKNLLWYSLQVYDPLFTNVSSETSFSAFISQFGRLEYKLLDKYVVTGVVRRDGSSKFGPENKYGVFPSISGAWKLSEENFIPELFHVLKLRASYGIVGNDRIIPFVWQPEFSIGQASDETGLSTVINQVEYQGAIIEKIPNTLVQWEEGRTTDVGIEMAFFKGRLSTTIDLYNRDTKNLLVARALPYSSGYGVGFITSRTATTVENAASINNKGIEVSVRNIIVSTKDFNWDVNTSYSYNLNSVVDVPGEEGQIVINNVTYKEGFPIGEVSAVITDGLFQTAEEITGAPTYSGRGNAQLGDQKYFDANGDGRITSDGDRVKLGNSNPYHLINVSTSLSYKFLELNIHAYSALDVYKVNTMNRNYLLVSGLSDHNGSKDLLRAWTPEEPNTDIPRMTTNNSIRPSDRFYENASFLKIGNIQLAAKLPSSLASKLHLSSLKAYVSMQNYFTFTKYSGLDPETRLQRGAVAQDENSYPTYKAFTVGFSVGL